MVRRNFVAVPIIDRCKILSSLLCVYRILQKLTHFTVWKHDITKFLWGLPGGIGAYDWGYMRRWWQRGSVSSSRPSSASNDDERAQQDASSIRGRAVSHRANTVDSTAGEPATSAGHLSIDSTRARTQLTSRLVRRGAPHERRSSSSSRGGGAGGPSWATDRTRSRISMLWHFVYMRRSGEGCSDRASVMTVTSSTTRQVLDGSGRSLLNSAFKLTRFQILSQRV